MEIFDREHLPTLLMVGGILAIAVVIFRAQWRTKSAGGGPRRDGPSPGAPPPHALSSGALAPRQDPVISSRQEIEMHELARHLTGRIDSKLSLLEGLVRDAREESERLEELLDRCERLSPGAATATRESTDDEAAASAHKRRRQDVYRLADEGCDTPTIAQKVGAPLGEVELILGLRTR